MSKKIGVIIIVIDLLLLFLGSWIFIVYIVDDEPHILFDVDVSDGRYSVKGYTLGELGVKIYVPIQVSVYDKEQKYIVVDFSASVNNGGSKLTDKNYSIDYTEEYIIIKFYDHEGEISGVHRFYYEDFTDIK